MPARQFAGSEELLGLNLNLLYDFEQGVGVIQSGHNGIAVRYDDHGAETESRD